MIPCYTRAISERFRGAARRSAIQIHVYFTLLYFLHFLIFFVLRFSFYQTIFLFLICIILSRLLSAFECILNSRIYSMSISQFTATNSNHDDVMRRRLAARYRRRGPFYLSCLPATSSLRRSPSVRSRPPAMASRYRDCQTVEDRREQALCRQQGRLGRRAV